MNNEYIRESCEIVGVVGEETFKKFCFDDIPVLVTKEKEYFNVYIIHPAFKTEPINNLEEQIPLENEPDNWELYLELRVIEKKLWFKYNKEFTIDVDESGY